MSGYIGGFAGATRAGHVRELLRRFGGKEVCDWRDRKGGTLLHTLAENGDDDAIAAALEVGISINIQRPTDGNTALHLAAWKKNRKVVDALKAAGARVDISNKYGERAEAECKPVVILHGPDPDFGSKHRDGILKVNQRILDVLVSQDTPEACSVASLTTVARFFHGDIDQARVSHDIEFVGLGIGFSGYPDRVNKFAQAHGFPWKVDVHAGDKNSKPFSKQLRLDLLHHFPQHAPPITNSIMIANYVRTSASKSGHWSPIAGVRWVGGKDPRPTHVLIADTHRELSPPHWIPFDQFVKLSSSYLPHTQSYRGYVIIYPEKSRD